MKRHAVSRTIGDADEPILAFGQFFEQVRRRPVHELDEEAVRKRGADMRGDFVGDVRRDLQPVSGRPANAKSPRLLPHEGRGVPLARGAGKARLLLTILDDLEFSPARPARNCHPTWRPAHRLRQLHQSFRLQA